MVVDGVAEVGRTATQPSQVRRLFGVAACFLVILGGPGCSFLAVRPEIRWVVSFHLTARPEDEGQLITAVRDLVDDRVYRLRKMPIASSRYILAAEPVEEDGKTTAVKFTMDPFNRLKWTQIVTEYGGRQVAVCVDGYYRFMWRVPRRYDTESHEVLVEGPWDSREAELIAEWAPANYRNLHNDPVAPPGD